MHLGIFVSVHQNTQRQVELAQEREELNRAIQENKLLDENEKRQ